MTKNVWVTADTHFNHARILEHTNWSTGERQRPGFDNVQEMNEALIEGWNSRVKQEDHVIHLGDVFFGGVDQFEAIAPRLNGTKTLILGNHDEKHMKYFLESDFFQKVKFWYQVSNDNLLMTHTSQHKSVLYRKSPDFPMLNVHGHEHSNPTPEGPYYCVCVEKHNFQPVSYDLIREKAKKFKKEC